MHQSITTKIKNSASKDWVVETIVKILRSYSINILSASISRNDSIEKLR